VGPAMIFSNTLLLSLPSWPPLLCFAKKVARAIKAAYPCKKVAEVVLGLEVNHAHIHLIPIDSEADVDLHHHIKLHCR
ncbi:MAG: hypothetical protein ACOCOY_05855, partial [Prevotella sp.]